MKYKKPKMKAKLLKDKVKQYEATAEKVEDWPITPYDYNDTTEFVDLTRTYTLEELGIKLPPRKFTEVVSLRLPSLLLNEIRALGSQHDIPYQALMKLFLAESVATYKKKLG
jgi:hypothetical protein